MIPVKLEMKNFFSHRSSVIDFSQFDAALLMGNIEGNYEKSNGSGKSALFEAILWCVFNKSRAASMDDIIHWGESDCRVDFIFSHGETKYRVVRERSRVKSKGDVHFYRLGENEEWVDISGSTPSLTNKEIEGVIRLDHKTFVNSAYFRQNDISEFAEAEPSRKKEILKSILDLSKWDEYEKKVKQALKKEKLQSEILHSKVEGYDSVEGLLEDVSEDLKESISAKNTLVKSIEAQSEELESLSDKYNDMKSNMDTESWDESVEKRKILESRLRIASKDYDIAISDLKQLNSRIESREQEIKKLENRISALKEEVDENVDDKIVEITNEAIELKADISVARANLKRLESKKISEDTCYVCDQNIGEDLYNSLISQRDKEIDKNKKREVYSKNKLQELSGKKKILDQVKNKNALFIKSKKELASAKDNVKELKSRTDLLSDKVKMRKKDVDSIKVEIKTVEEVINSLKNDDFKGIRNSIEEKKKTLKISKDSFDKLNIKIGALTEKKNSLDERLKDMKKFKKELVLKEKDIYLKNKTAKLLGKNGIQTILLNAVIEDLEETANDILSNICNESFVIYLDTQKVASDGVSVIDTLILRVNKEGTSQDFKSLSGGEKFRVSLALRIALSEISSRHGGSNLEFLLLDEVDSPLDQHGKESLFLNVIKSLEKRYKMLVITHDNTLKEKFTDVLDVSKNHGESTVEYISM